MTSVLQTVIGWERDKSIINQMHILMLKSSLW